jgi:hypothetical protein
MDENYKFREAKAKLIKIIRKWNNHEECFHDSSYNLFRWVNKYRHVIKSKEDIINYLRLTDGKLYTIDESQIYENVELMFYQDCCKNLRDEFGVEELIHEEDDKYEITENGTMIIGEKKKHTFPEDNEEFEDDSNSDEPIDFDEDDEDNDNTDNQEENSEDEEKDFEKTLIRAIIDLNFRIDPESIIPYEEIKDKEDYIHRLCARIQFKNIIRGGTHFGEIPKYVMKWVIIWIYDYNDIVKCKEEINKIIYDYENNETIKSIIQNIFYGEYYQKLREEFDIIDNDFL